jgi:hypothetical protein
VCIVEESAPAEKRFGSMMFWRMFALINQVTVMWVAWVIWQIIPRPVVYDFVLRLPNSQVQRTAPGANPGAPTTEANATAGAAPATAVPSGAVLPELPIQNGPPMTPLRMDTEMKALPKARQPAASGK